MDNNNLENKEEAKQGTNINEEIYRITISKIAEQHLSSIADKVNHGFEGGKVNRTQIANWVLAKFSGGLNESEIKEIRAEHFDEIAVLEALLRRAKKTGKVPVEIKGVLQKQFGFDEAPRKAKRSGLTKDNINDVIIDNGKSS